ncbi:Arginine-tRNA ligase [Trinorchestia longiramus]|nr:Arginine-tRNA ligase [Trinorchestia longiramus]
MTSKVRMLLANKLLQSFSAVAGSSVAPGPKAAALLPLLKVNPKVSTVVAAGGDVAAGGGCLRFDVSMHRLHKALFPDEQEHHERNNRLGELQDLSSSLLEHLWTDSTLVAAHTHTLSQCQDLLLSLTVSGAEQCCEVLHNVVLQPSCFWHHSDLLRTIPHQRVLIDFSSPNIAKPFHVGHLRSTFLGHCLSRLHAALGHHVTKLNYLGDWGTQFGLLKYGCDSRGLTRADLQEDAIRKLYEVYVWVNKAAEQDPDINVRANEIFAKMESGDPHELDHWRFFRDISLKELQQTYDRLGISFDEYHGESDYNAAKCAPVLRQMEEKGLLEQLPDGRKMFEFVPGRKVTVVKSDGSGVYLTRDITAAVDRFQKFSFDRHYYVVDIKQIDHFKALRSALSALGYSWADRLRHVRFGRIQGLSSRKGAALFLSDLLEDGRHHMLEQQTLTSTTLVSGEDAVTAADVVALSAIVVADLKRRRHKDYHFSWQDALKSTGDTGVRLQYAHCRLVQLEQNCGVVFNADADTSSLACHPAALACVANIIRFEEVLYEFHESLEPYLLVDYLVKLSNSINQALRELKVRGAPEAEAEARLLLFVAARHTLAASLSILGLTPLKQM